MQVGITHISHFFMIFYKVLVNCQFVTVVAVLCYIQIEILIELIKADLIIYM